MRYGNTSVPGLYKYDSGTQYEPGDFVFGYITDVHTGGNAHYKHYKYFFTDIVFHINTSLELEVYKGVVCSRYDSENRYEHNKNQRNVFQYVHCFISEKLIQLSAYILRKR